MMNTEGIYIRGVGAVSAAGWSAVETLQAVRSGIPLAEVSCNRPADERPWPCQARVVPAMPAEKAARHPRLRRASAITRYSVAAALEALVDAGHSTNPPPKNLGILFVMMNGCVNYTGRFYQEVLVNPAQASPLIFPETVFNAPASHIASFLGVDGAVSTLVGSPNAIVEALDTAALWIRSGIVDECLLIAAEECDWLSAEALTYYHPKLVASEGAGALLLSAHSAGTKIEKIFGPACYTSWQERSTVLPELAQKTTAASGRDALLVDDSCGIERIDRAERLAWQSAGLKEGLRPKQVLGECMGASAVLQMALGALEAREQKRPIVVSMPGANTAAYTCVLAP